ncbi:hypothetical protein C8F04DRAFT_1299979 [Mycena alexandri]|uniref:MaoC-like domain-containing protein n=1 Tax=Mycena alexandri TaxID=1745969 RepID=A0AAD6SEC8_9AGAR|nr:hypothetical protein C8F04DRAFT_1299979 [Mycena alexandri]
MTHTRLTKWAIQKLTSSTASRWQRRYRPLSPRLLFCSGPRGGGVTSGTEREAPPVCPEPFPFRFRLPMIEIIKDLPLVSGSGWTFEFPLRISAFLAGFQSGPTPSFSKHIAGPPQGEPVPTDRKADWVVRDQTTKEQALVFRLSGDYNPLHIGALRLFLLLSSFLPHLLPAPSWHSARNNDRLTKTPALFVDPKIGQGAGFGGRDPRSLRFFGVRFTSPVRPGDALQTEAWEVGAGPQGAFVTRNLTSGKVVLGGGVAFVLKKAEAHSRPTLSMQKLRVFDLIAL